MSVVTQPHVNCSDWCFILTFFLSSLSSLLDNKLTDEPPKNLYFKSNLPVVYTHMLRDTHLHLYCPFSELVSLQELHSFLPQKRQVFYCCLTTEIYIKHKKVFYIFTVCIFMTVCDSNEINSVQIHFCIGHCTALGNKRFVHHNILYFL